MTDRPCERSQPLGALRAEVEAELERGGRQLIFPPALEVRYRLDRAQDRSYELQTFTRTAAVLYLGIGLLMKLAGVTHENWGPCLVQLGCVSGAALLIAQYAFRPNTPDSLREGSALACCLLGSLGAILVAYLAPVTLQDLIIAALPTNFALMFMRLRFSAAVAFALISFCAYGTGILLRPALTAPQDAFLTVFMAILCLPALVGVHALERTSRRLYLHLLLQSLRLEGLAVENNALTVLSLTDPLTKIANRRRLDIELRAFCQDSQHYGALLLIDVDLFKTFNDRHGHHAGDLCLQQVAERLSVHLRTGDLLARFGGEEFAVLLPSVAEPEAAATGERLRASIEAQPFVVDGVSLHVTVSIGVAALGAERAPEALLEAADLALYAAKTAGRNQVRT